MGKTRRSGNACCVPGCRADGDLSKIKFYCFPIRSYNLEKRSKWIKTVKRINADGSSWEPSSRSRICSQHFVGGEKSEHPHSPSYLPTIFPEKYYGKQNKTEAAQLKAQHRFARAMQRNQNRKCLELENTELTNMKKMNDLQNSSMGIIHQDNMDMIIQPPEPRFCEAATQVDFYEDDVSSIHINMFSVLRENEGTCEAGTQANVSFKKSKKNKYNSEEYG